MIADADPDACLGPLSPGAQVALVCPSGRPADAPLTDGIALLTAWGLQVVPYPSTTIPHPYATWLAAPDAVRAADIEDAWCDPSIDAIFCARGGYGAARILDLLDADRMRAARPKPVYGYSDVTALHEWLREELGVASWHAPMVGTASTLAHEATVADLRRAVFEPWRGRVLTRPGAEALVRGEASGRLIGGNLCVLAMTVGARTRRGIDNTGCLALLEDVGEDTYKYDGYLVQLLRAGWFDGVTGILLGSWQDSVLAELRPLVEELLVPFGVPLVWEFGFGHVDAPTILPLGVDATLSALDVPTLTLAP